MTYEPRTLRRIPESLPMVVRPRAALLAGVFVAPTAGVTMCLLLFGMLLLMLPIHDRPQVICGMVVIIFVCAGVGLVWARVALRGPLLAADTSGVWLRGTVVSKRVVFVPWQALRRIRPQLGGVIEVVHFEPYPSFHWPNGRLTGTAGIAGPGATIPVAFGQTRLEQLLNELGRLSGGQVPIG